MKSPSVEEQKSVDAVGGSDISCDVQSVGDKLGSSRNPIQVPCSELAYATCEKYNGLCYFFC